MFHDLHLIMRLEHPRKVLFYFLFEIYSNFSKLVLEYLTSEEAQDLITQGNKEFGGSFEYPVNPRVKLRGFLKEISTFKENKDFNLEINNNLGVKAKELMSELDWK